MFTVLIWLIPFLAIALALTELVRKRAFNIADAGALILPFALWFCLISTTMKAKSLANIVEAIILLPLVIVGFVVRVYAFKGTPHKKRSIIALLFGLVAAIAVYALTPVLPE